ncbi:hypothetical protein TVAG_370800 [Trichomonas vaginalis G3]|uniref:Leucine Rich Repeat family protein n=1 Tax=Trichomonas vaginalis (strain ATCC PRA-98 / G3) TaxID=412133 RepID=A2FHN2_TRIV3|nr:leucine-rich repeat, isoform f-related family [Trichomonas vaginalis G3]EAX95576.1 hypothetical protein TVAG_370800 [Trichomonas vaginalis G3]KAI5486924.1 leucine-rich repeat, isoform f-related family [Trichomonas vaginalis G3]|eukprot:XP_001308506.1 hypothetical protein [Trichomonas vaginalis G3]
MNEEQLAQIHPLMKAQGVKVMWHGNVGKINTHGDVQPRYLVITTIGLFLLVKKKFPSGYKLSRQMSLSRMKSITLTTDFIEFKSDDTNIVVEHEKINYMAALIDQLNTSMTGTSILKASTQLKSIVMELQLDINQELTIIDRFISECLALNVPVQLDQISAICKNLETQDDVMTITPSLAASSLMPALASALRGNTLYKSIVLKDLSFISFFPHLSTILKLSTSINSISFYRTSFLETNLSTPPGFFEKEVNAPIKSITFTSCDLTNPRFKDFFYEFAKMKAQINSFTIDRCEFIPSSFESIFYSIFDAPCFRTLTNLTIKKINLAESVQMFSIQLMNCDWVLKKKSLRKFVCQQIPLHLELLIPAFMMFESGLQELSLSGCGLSKPISKPIPTFQDITVLDLSEITTSAKNLESLLLSIQGGNHHIKNLDLSALKMTMAESDILYPMIDSIEFKGIQTLVWDSNKVTNQSLPHFVDFLTKQKSVFDLSISDCILNKPTNIDQVLRIVRELPLERFVMAGQSSFSFGTEYNDVLDALISRGTVVSIDISGHGIGDQGLENIERLISSGTKALAFNSTCANNAEKLLHCLKTIITSDVEFSLWPAPDIRRILTKIPLQSRERLLKEFGTLKKQFEEKYKLESTPELVMNEESITKLRRMSSIPLLLRDGADHSQLPHLEPLRFQNLSTREQNLTTLLQECIGPKACGQENDPFVIFFNQWNIDTSIDKFEMSL